MVAPPVPPKSSQAKFAGRRAIFEQNGIPKQPAKNTSDNLERTFGPRMQNLMKNHNIDIHGSTNQLNAREKADSALPKPNVMEEKKVTLAAGDELETVKFLKTLSKKKRENLGFSPKQSDGKEVQSQSLSEKDTFPELPACAHKPALFPKPSKEKIREALDKVRNNSKASSSASVENDTLKISSLNDVFASHPTYKGKKRFSLDNMSSNSSSCSEKSNISDISNKSNNSNIVRCNVTRSNSKEDLRKPDASHNDKSAGKKLSNVNVSELIRKFEQGNDIVKGR